MRWTFRSLTVVAAWACACSVLNSFDDVGEILPDGGAGSSGQGGSNAGGGEGGEPGSGGTTAGKGGSGGSSGTSPGGNGGDGGEAGGNDGSPLDSAIVVGQRIGSGASARHELVVLDPADGSEVARNETDLQIHAIAYEAPRDLWFVFTGSVGPGGDSDVLVGRVTRAGFAELGRTTVTDGKPSGQSTMTVLNQRILYRTVQSDGITTSDKLVLLNTSDPENLTIRGSVDLPPERRILATLGRPSPTAVGGRVTFIHFNPNSANCMDIVDSRVCPVSTSSMQILPAVTNPSQPPPATVVDWVTASGSLPAGATDLKNGFDYFVVPPDANEGGIGKVYKYDTTSTQQAAVDFDLGTSSTVSISAAVIDPCSETVVASELATTRRVYAVPMAAGGTVASVPLNAAAGGLAYEPYTRTVIQFLQDPTNPSLRGFQLGGTATEPTLTERGTSGALPWRPPANPPLNPSFVVVKSPLQPPCN